MSQPGKQELGAAATALIEAERKFCRLRAEREAVEEKLDKAGAGAFWQTDDLRSDLKRLDQQIDDSLVEGCELRIALLRAELPSARDAVAPLKASFEQAEANCRHALAERCAAALAFEKAKTAASSLESAIAMHEKTVREVKQRRAIAKRAA
jgi:chromosome segregation ATPase